MSARHEGTAWWVPLLAAAVFAAHYAHYDGTALDYWDTYIVAPAATIAGAPGTFVDEHGKPAYRWQARGRLPDDLIAKDAFGVMSQDQRIGAGVTYAPAYRVFGVAGFRLLHAALGACAFLFAFVVLRALRLGDGAATLGALVIALNPYLLLMNRLNANFVAVPILLAVTALLIAERPHPLSAGLLFGALGGVKNEAVVLIPAVLVMLTARPRGWFRRLRATAIFGAGALATIAPYLAWNRVAFGKAIIHASQYSDFEGWRPTFPHEILGLKFRINGLFNWPFHDHLVRTPHYPFPTYLTLPLTLHLCFGGLLLALAAYGAWALARAHGGTRESDDPGDPEGSRDAGPAAARPFSDRAAFATMLLWLVFWLGLFLFQENWEEPKTTFGAPAVIPLGVFAAAGMARWWAARRDLRSWTAVAVLIVVIESLVVAARFVRVPVDERWYVRFPKSVNEQSLNICLDDLSRREWVFFHTDECLTELGEQRHKLTRVSLLPRPYYPLENNPTVRGDWRRFRPDIFDVWQKIYGK